MATCCEDASVKAASCSYASAVALHSRAAPTDDKVPDETAKPITIAWTFNCAERDRLRMSWVAVATL